MSTEFISLNQCRHGYLYLLSSRNLGLGVFNKKVKGFIGIRTKFGSRFLDTEYHWDTGAPYGTANPEKELNKLPDIIVPVESLGSFDRITGRPIIFDQPIFEGGVGWYFSDTGEPSKAITPTYRSNLRLFNYLRDYELTDEPQQS